MAVLVSSIVKEQKKCNEFMFSSDYLMKKMFSASFFGERSGYSSGTEVSSPHLPTTNSLQYMYRPILHRIIESVN